jgi:hypothetical protein
LGSAIFFVGLQDRPEVFELALEHTLELALELAVGEAEGI